MNAAAALHARLWSEYTTLTCCPPGGSSNSAPACQEWKKTIIHRSLSLDSTTLRWPSPVTRSVTKTRSLAGLQPGAITRSVFKAFCEKPSSTHDPIKTTHADAARSSCFIGTSAYLEASVFRRRADRFNLEIGSSRSCPRQLLVSPRGRPTTLHAGEPSSSTDSHDKHGTASPVLWTDISRSRSSRIGSLPNGIRQRNGCNSAGGETEDSGKLGKCKAGTRSAWCGGTTPRPRNVCISSGADYSKLELRARSGAPAAIQNAGKGAP